jgi:SAM-dependent methyltransferase
MLEKMRAALSEVVGELHRWDVVLYSSSPNSTEIRYEILIAKEPKVMRRICKTFGMVDIINNVRHGTKADLEQLTASAISLGRERLHPSRRNADYLGLIERRKQMAEALRHIDGNELRALDVGGRIQPYRPLLDGRLQLYVAIDPQRTGLVDVVGVGEHLPFCSASFDLVLCSGVLCYVEDPPRLIDEIYSVLRPGGTLLISVPAILPHHDENDRWRFLPDGLSALLSRFSRVEVSPEGNSFLGACRIVALFLDSSVENRIVRKLVDSAIIPLVNLAGERMNDWCRGNTALTNNYFAFARK